MYRVRLPHLLIMLCCLAVIIDSCTKDKVQPSVEGPVSFSKDLYPVFASSNGHCGTSSCHAVDQFRPPIFNTLDSCYLSLRNDSAVGAGTEGYKYVNTVYPDSSLLYIMLTSQNPPGAGGRMPQGGPYLSSEFTGKVLRWIQQGAANN
jgi:hypothetical protein